MLKNLVNHTKFLYSTACYISKNKSIGFVPYPKNNFKDVNDIFKYLKVLNKYVRHPELSYINPEINKRKIDMKSTHYLNKNFFKFF